MPVSPLFEIDENPCRNSFSFLRLFYNSLAIEVIANDAEQRARQYLPGTIVDSDVAVTPGRGLRKRCDF